jgi:hypothetical protein
MIDDLAELVRAIQSALAHRVTTTRFQDDVRSADVVFRGGLNKIIAIIDVPLKCGLGMMRSFRKENEGGRIGYDELGAVALLATHSKTLCRHAMFVRAESQLPLFYPCLAHIEINVARVFSPSQYVSIVHEAAHIVRRSLVAAENGGMDPGLGEWGPIQSFDPQQWVDANFQTNRREELFVDFVILILVCGGDWQLFARYSLMEFSGNPVVREPSMSSMRIAFLEKALQVFVVIDAIREWQLRYGEDYREWPKFHPYAFNVESPIERTEAERRFVVFLNEFGRYFYYWEAIGNEEMIERYARNAFQRFWKSVFPGVIGKEYNRALRMLDIVLSRLSEDDMSCVEQACREAMENSAPDVRGTLFEQGLPEPDELYLVCALLRECLRSQYLEVPPGVEMHLPRAFGSGEPNGTVNLPPGQFTMHTFQVDPAAGYLRCFDPQERRRRCSRDITLMKTLWDISTVLRARRVKSLYNAVKVPQHE